MKIFIVGAGGTLGSATAYALAMKGLGDEFVLYDINKQAAAHHAMDIMQGVCLTSKIQVAAGDMEDMAGSDLVIVAAGLPLQTDIEKRLLNLAKLEPLMRQMAEQAPYLAPGAAIISLTNPVDVFNYLLYERMGLPRERFLGLSLCDTIRMRHAISRYTGIKAHAIECFVVGEHGRTKVPVYSDIYSNEKKLEFSEEDIRTVTRLQTEWWDTFIGQGIPRTAGWTSASAVAMMVEAMYGHREAVLPCSCIPGGEYGLSGISIGLPVKLCPSGVSEIVELTLSTEERAALTYSAGEIRGGTERLKAVMQRPM